MIYLLYQARIITHVDAGEGPRTRDTQEITQEVNQIKRNPIENWLSTVPLALENLVDPLLPKMSENMSSNSDISSDSSEILTLITPSAGTGITGGVRDRKLRGLLSDHNIFINNTDASTELVKRAKEIITKELTPEMDDALAQSLALVAWRLETGSERDIVKKLVTPLIPAITEVPHQSLESSQNKRWADAVTVPLRSGVMVIQPPLPKPQPDFVFGYSNTAFNHSQFEVSRLLVTESGMDYATPDGEIRFPFLAMKIKAQAKGGTHFVATNQAANAGAVAMQGTLELARRISTEEKVDFDQPQFFSISIDHAVANIHIHWLSRNAGNGAFCFHMGQLQRHLLDVDGLKAINLAVRGILQYGANERLAKIGEELDIFSQKVNEKAIIGQGNLASDLLPGEQQQQRRPRKRKNANSSYRQQGPRIKRSRRVRQNNADDEDEGEEEEEDGEEESAISSAAEQLQISRKKTTPIVKDSRLDLLKRATKHQRAKEQLKPARTSARLSARDKVHRDS